MPTECGWPVDSPCLACRRQVMLGLGFLGFAQPLVPGTNRDSQSGRVLCQIEEANLSDDDKLGLG